MKKIYFIIICMFILAVSACNSGSSDSNNGNDPQIEEKAEITSFSFTKSANPSLTKDIQASIKGTNITTILPSETDLTSLVASFTYNGASVTIGETQQVSGVSVNNFSDTVVYSVFNTDKTKVDYNVRVVISGLLDTTFGTGGIVMQPDQTCMGISSIALQPDGKIISGWEVHRQNETKRQFTIARQNIDGSFDSSFGTEGNGIVKTAIGSISGVYSIVLQPDQKIIAVGTSIDEDYKKAYFALARYNNDGSLDKTFGTNGNGTVLTTNGDDICQASKSVLQPDGKIVVVGFSFPNILIIARYNNDGSLDSTFNGGGIVTTNIKMASHNFGYLRSIAIQQDLKILISCDSYMIRYNTDGTIDKSFGTDSNGIVVDENIWGFAIQQDGKILVNSTSSISRFNNDGTPDKSFGTEGRVNGFSIAIQIQPDGKIVSCGYYDSDNHPEGIVLIRLNIDGTFDKTFGNEGIVKTKVGTNGSVGLSLALQDDGKIIVGGGFCDKDWNWLGVVILRYWP